MIVEMKICKLKNKYVSNKLFYILFKICLLISLFARTINVQFSYFFIHTYKHIIIIIIIIMMSYHEHGFP